MRNSLLIMRFKKDNYLEIKTHSLHGGRRARKKVEALIFIYMFNTSSAPSFENQLYLEFRHARGGSRCARGGF